MSDMTPDSAREKLEEAKKADWCPDDTTMALQWSHAEGYLDRDAQLRPLIEGLVGALEIDPIFPQANSEDDWRAKDDFATKRRVALTLAHKAGFGVKVSQ